MSKKGSITTADYFQYDEFKRLIDCLIKDGQHLWAFYCMMSFCLGLRSSDVRKLKWHDVLNKRTVVVTEQKTGKTKGIPIGQNTAEHITKMYEMEGNPNLDNYIFCTKRAKENTPVTIQYINRIAKIWKAKYKLKIGNFSSHTFRKTFGRYVYEKRNRSTDALIELNRIFRHANLQTTLIYIGITDDNIYGVFDSIRL
jgi:integrase